MTTILIVEDDRATAGLLKTVFEMEGYKTLACPQPERVIEVVRRDKPDLIFMDYHLAESESLPVLQAIKKDPEFRMVAILMTSGLDRSEECSRAGADGFLIKPFRPANLVAAVRAILETKEHR